MLLRIRLDKLRTAFQNEHTYDTDMFVTLRVWAYGLDYVPTLTLLRAKYNDMLNASR